MLPAVLSATAGAYVASETAMPYSWDSAVYWQRAAAWRERAHLLAEADRTRDICLSIATDYERLARTLEERERLVKTGAGTAHDA
jgi:transposase